MPPPEIRIMAEPSRTDPGVCKFTVDRYVYEGGPFLFREAAASRGSALVDALFGLTGVVAVIVHNHIVTVTMKDGDWGTLAKQVGGAIRSTLQAGGPTLSPEAVKALGPSDADVALREKVEQFIQDEINPSVAAHGGYIQVIDVKDGNLYIAMGGGCQGCGAADVTLKQGVERMLKDNIPEVKQVLDTTDHAQGANPYYAPSK
ncbi:MAG: NifU family protein [Planctomycetes bacterium]|nr:NifU family protein [Planctomycetota bacterium]